LKPEFSIVTPTFRQLDWLRLCIASVRDQVLHSALSIEHIVQDAGTPGIEDLARELGAEFYRDGQLIFQAKECGLGVQPAILQSAPDQAHYSLKIFSEKDAGMYDAINRGLTRSAGEICAWLNSDEQYLPDTLSKVAEIFHQQTKLDVLLGDAILLNASLEPVCYRRIMVPSLWHTRLAHLHSLSCAMFFRKSCLPAPPLDPQWKVIGDAVLMDRWLREGRKIHACGNPLSCYTFTGSNLSAGHLGAQEHERWLGESGLRAKWRKPGIVMLHRFRRLMHRAYERFSVSLDYHVPEGRRQWQGKLPGTWPKSA
jgi:glycosyltransferase involved in cell wall biosynthesis